MRRLIGLLLLPAPPVARAVWATAFPVRYGRASLASMTPSEPPSGTGQARARQGAHILLAHALPSAMFMVSEKLPLVWDDLTATEQQSVFAGFEHRDPAACLDEVLRNLEAHQGDVLSTTVFLKQLGDVLQAPNAAKCFGSHPHASIVLTNIAESSSGKDKSIVFYLDRCRTYIRFHSHPGPSHERQ